MKGIILAGGLGTRLNPLTKVTNKHLLPLYHKPMIFFPLETLVGAGVKDILIVSGPGHAGHFLNLLGSGKDFGVKLSYEIQEEAGGIAQALGLAQDFVAGQKIAVVLGDNVFEDDISKAAQDFENQAQGAKVFLKTVPDPKRFGVAQVEGAKIVNIEEKPQEPKSNLAVTGLYMYDKQVFDVIEATKPSARGELEITDVNNAYVKRGNMTYELLNGFWSDAGTFESLHRASKWVAENLDVKSPPKPKGPLCK